MESYLSDEFLDRVRRAYQFALEAGARTSGRTWQSIDARRQDVHSALVAEGNTALRAVFADPIATDLYYGTDNLCHSLMGSSGGRSFLDLALQSRRAKSARHQVDRVRFALSSIGGRSVIEIGPGVGHCAFFARTAGVPDYATVDLPLGIVAQCRFLAEALGPNALWFDGEGDTENRLKLFSNARLPPRMFDLVLNVDSMTEMSLTAALSYLRWINEHAHLFLSMNHEVNPFTVASIAHQQLHGTQVWRRPVDNRDGYFEELFAINHVGDNEPSFLFWLRARTAFRSIAIPLMRRIPFLRRQLITPGLID